MLKTLATIVGTTLALIAYASYIRDTLRGVTRPHAFSWFLWATVTLLVFFFQVKAGGGFGSLITLVVGVLCLTVFVMALRQGKQNIKFIDLVCLLLSLGAIPLWIVTKDPLWSVVLLSLIDILAFAPTVRKSWNDPFTETLSTYGISAVRHCFAVVALTEVTLTTSLFPITWVVINSLFSLTLLYRRTVMATLTTG